MTNNKIQTAAAICVVFGFVCGGVLTSLLLAKKWSERLRVSLIAGNAVAQKNCDDRVQQLAQNQAAFYAMNEQFNKITLYMRDAYRQEMEQGLHNNIAFGDLIVQYLKRERRYTHVPLVGLKKEGRG